MIDLTVGDGKTALVAIRRNASLIGVTFNELHRERLYQKLEADVFREMQDAESPLYEVGLVSLLGKKRKGVCALNLLYLLQTCEIRMLTRTHDTSSD